MKKIAVMLVVALMLCVPLSATMEITVPTNTPEPEESKDILGSVGGLGRYKQICWRLICYCCADN